MTSTELQWIEFTDFSPGIHSDNHLAGGVEVTALNPAMASPTNTYRCRSLPSGGLGPLPRNKEAFSLTTPPTADGTVIINGLGTWGQVITDDLDSNHRIEVHLLLSYLASEVGAAAWIREHIYDTTPYTETIYSDLTGGASMQYQFAYFLKTRMNPASVTDPGEIVMVCVYNPPSQDAIINQVHPDPADPDGSSGTADLASASGIYRRAMAHQGRIVLGRYQVYERGSETTISTTENIVWTDVNSNVLTSSTAAVFVPEIDQSISDWASMSANQAIVVKELGGGYVLQGDLDDVTVVRLPNLMSPDGSAVVQGANTAIGWVYSAGDRGLYLWNGGDQSEPLSPQLDGREFTDGLSTAGYAGSCDRWLDLLVTPNLWTCDLNTRGWWRLDDPAEYPSPIAFISTTKYRQQMIVARQEFDTTDTEAFYLFEYGDLAYSWSWQSHPIWVSLDRYLEIRQGVIALQGHGTVTITLSTYDDGGNEVTDIHEIDIDSDYITNFRFNCNLTGDSFRVRVESEGHEGEASAATSEAPLLHRMYFGYQPTRHIALTDTTAS